VSYCRTDEAYCATNDAKKEAKTLLLLKRDNWDIKTDTEVLL
jgi:hypothetical protein